MGHFLDPMIFVSATSRGLKSLRVGVQEYLQLRKYRVLVQEEFECDYQRIKDMIRDTISPCDAVVLLVGPAYGFEAADWPDGVPKCSYTQLEYELAIELKKPVYRFLASAKYPFTPYEPEPAEHQERQQVYIRRLKAQDYVWYEFDSQEQLKKLLEKTHFHRQVKPNLPFDSIRTLFKGREDDLKRVRQSLLTRPAHATAVVSKQAIHGLGGVGKTRFAIEYAHRYASEYSARLYAIADTPWAIDTNLAALCHTLDLPEQHDKEQPIRLEAVQRWLRTHAGWLVILDNVDTPAAQAAAATAFNNLTNGHVLITSRLTDWGANVTAVELDTLTIRASADFLLERTGGHRDAPTGPRRQMSESDPTEASALAADLGGLALALERAGAYICANRITFAEYRVRLTEIEREVLKWFDADAMKYPKSVATTWQASVSQLYPDGRALLNLLAWLATDPIPAALVRTVPQTPPVFAIANRERALQDLSTYSLVKWNADGSAVTVHRLVQEVTRLRLTDSVRKETLKDSLWVVDAFLEGDPQNSAQTWKDVYAPAERHVANIAYVAEEMGIEEPTDRLLNQIGIYYIAAGNYRAGERACRHALTLLDRRYGHDHINVASPLSNLAASLSQTGRARDAIPLLHHAMAITKAAYGDNHVEMARLLNELAEALRRTDQFAEAEHVYREALAIYDANNIVNHAHKATLLNNLAGLLSHFGRPEEAEPLSRHALAIDEAIHGPLHLDVARDLSTLCASLIQTEKVSEAEELCRRALSIVTELLGRDHPHVGIVLNNQAEILRRTKRPADALPLCQRALEIAEAAFGPMDENVALHLTNLAAVLLELGRALEATLEMQRALAIDEAVSGGDRPDVAIRRFNLAELFMATNRLTEAEPHLRQAIAILMRFEEQTGHRHPQLEIIASEYGGLLQELGRTPRQVDLAFQEIVQEARGQPQP